MNIIKRYSILASLMVLTSCSYFNTNDELSVSSKDLNAEEIVVEEPALGDYSVENIIYRKSKGAVEIYNLDVSEETAAESFSPLGGPETARSAGALTMNPGVEIYPIDVPMQKTLKPGQ